MEECNEFLKNYTVGFLPTLFYIPDFISESEGTQLLHHIYQVPISKWKSLKKRRLQDWGGVVHEKGLIPMDLPTWLTILTTRISEQTGLFPSPINHVLINEYLPDQGIMPHQDGPAYFPVVAILSLESPVVMNFFPHPRLRDCVDKGLNTANGSSSDERKTDIGDDPCLKKAPCSPLDQHRPFSLLLMPRSLLIFKDQAYSDYLHGIEDSKEHSTDEVVNVLEALKHHEKNHSSSSDGPPEAETEGKERQRSINRTTTRVSLTCRLVPKVHKNPFKFCRR